jgi:hypothetical protein
MARHAPTCRDTLLTQHTLRWPPDPPLFFPLPLRANHWYFTGEGWLEWIMGLNMCEKLPEITCFECGKLTTDKHFQAYPYKRPISVPLDIRKLMRKTLEEKDEYDGPSVHCWHKDETWCPPGLNKTYYLKQDRRNCCPHFARFKQGLSPEEHTQNERDGRTTRLAWQVAGVSILSAVCLTLLGLLITGDLGRWWTSLKPTLVRFIRSLF